MSKSIVFAVIVGAGLAFTNPEKSEFVQFLNKQIIKSMDEKTPDLGKEGKTFASGLMAIAIDKTTERKDYFVFSVYNVDTSVFRLFNNDVPDLKFLGIGSQFIPMGKTIDFAQQKKQSQTQQSRPPIETEKPAAIQAPIPTASLESAVKAIEGEIDYSFNQPLLKGIYGFENRFPAFDTPEGKAEVERLNKLITEKIKNLN